ncbi:MAG: sulfite exporter TauE/SafE family protein [Nanoarchaeota archaeon]|nr:sulfite exporter TauE/SafE family protein [Nanoarchaeota archaeon]
MKKTFNIKGMHCNSCAQRIEDKLKDKVESVSASYSKEQAEIDFNENKISEREIKKRIKELGYEIKEESKKSSKKTDWVGWSILIGSLIVLFYVLSGFISKYNLEIPVLGESGSLILLFFVGVLTGFHCVSMCGGFVVSYTTKNALKGHKSFKQHLVYGGTKVFSYALIGGIFGLIGGVIAFSIGLRGGIAIFAGLFMIFYGLNMLGFKWFKRFQFNPKFLSKIATTKHTGPYKGPFFTGLLSGLFIACGPLQAMYLYAMGTGGFISGLSALVAFGIGTLPVMLGFGSLATVISHKTTAKILKAAAIIVIILGVVMLNRGLTVLGSPISYDIIKDKVIEVESKSAMMVGNYQEINMEVNRYGWEPKSFVLKQGVPVKWNIDVKELTGCNNEIIVRDYDLDIKLKKGMNVVEFTPDKTGTVRWSCWMGMIPGSFIVTEDGQASQEQLNQVAQISSSGGSCGCGG